ncbi:hypothetical protein PP940_gp018 [Rhizobium phage RL2RES]|uniref:Uncharacterized protein n=1 Tax=Rhizobium phage RL2RES TaxID=103371 RepID=A0A6B9J1Z5_9CAUD|nr:hypothetical protein PP940_gp018 [Rhizobium phage RL2RES]QGZ14277.1 hypothetical protein RL2RES_018 [Rhizobium phage RL2RES]
MSQIIMKNWFDGVGSQVSIFAVAECTHDEAMSFCYRMNSSASSSYEDLYFVETDYIECDAAYLKAVADGAEESKKARDEATAAWLKKGKKN